MGEDKMKNNIVLITGATQGIGLATSKLLNSNGYQVVRIARNNLQNFPGELYTCDLSDRMATDKVLHKIKDRYPQILHIINNVGIVARQPLEEVDLDTLSMVFDLNVRTASHGYGSPVCIDKDASCIEYVNASYPELETHASDIIELKQLLKNRQFDLSYLFNSFYAFPDQQGSLKVIAELKKTSFQCPQNAQKHLPVLYLLPHNLLL